MAQTKFKPEKQLRTITKKKVKEATVMILVHCIDMLRTKFKSEKEERVMTHNLRKEDVLFVYTAPHVITPTQVSNFKLIDFKTTTLCYPDSRTPWLNP